jgi:hypothetical protein
VALHEHWGFRRQFELVIAVPELGFLNSGQGSSLQRKEKAV